MRIRGLTRRHKIVKKRREARAVCVSLFRLRKNASDKSAFLLTLSNLLLVFVISEQFALPFAVIV